MVVDEVVVDSLEFVASVVVLEIVVGVVVVELELLVQPADSNLEESDVVVMELMDSLEMNASSVHENEFE